MTTFRHRWLPYLASSAAFALIVATAFPVDAAITDCETTTLTNANFEATAGGKAAHWCDDYERGYSRVLLTPAKYNYVARASIPTTVPAARRYAGPRQIVNLNQTQAKNVFVGAMIKGSNIVLDTNGWGAILDVGFSVDCSRYPQVCQSNNKAQFDLAVDGGAA